MTIDLRLALSQGLHRLFELRNLVGLYPPKTGGDFFHTFRPKGNRRDSSSGGCRRKYHLATATTRSAL
jgi:hypothetical protein